MVHCPRSDLLGQCTMKLVTYCIKQTPKFHYYSDEGPYYEPIHCSLHLHAVFLEDPFLCYSLIYAKISYIMMVFTDQYFICISHLHQYVPCSMHLIPFGWITPVTPPVKDNNTMDTTEMKYDTTVVCVCVCVCVVGKLQVQWLVFQPKDGNSRHPTSRHMKQPIKPSLQGWLLRELQISHQHKTDCYDISMTVNGSDGKILVKI